MSIQGSIKCNNGGKITAGLYGKICKVAVKEGSKVKKGDNIIVMEAMKMEIPIAAPCDGRVGRLLVNVGDSIERGQEIAVVA